MGIDRGTTFTWYGHSCWEVATPGGHTILLDPWFSNPRSPKSAAAVDRCDVLLVTHGHDDHFSDCLLIGSRTRPTSVYLAYPGSRVQVEVFDPSAREARRLVASGQVQPVR